jgi:tRNA 2-selenouridine synthase
MSLQVTDDVTAAALARYDMVIDVRSPGEFAEDHMPGAVNLPVLSDAERAEVGTIYVQDSRFKARRLGAAYVARNVAQHIQTALADKPGGFRPLVYCWRGGMRSNAMALILSQVGWPTTVLTGGYRTYRRRVTARLYDEALPHRFLLIDGETGSGKTKVLSLLAGQGVQTLDLEALAEHRGSLFGGRPGHEQPSQKLFESRLLAAVDALDPGRVVVAEAEASKIGDRMIPPALWTRMSAAPQVELVAARPDRARFLAQAYADIAADPERLQSLIARLPVQPSAERRAAWMALIAAGDLAAFAEALTALHYDPAYARARRKHGRESRATIPIAPLDDASCEVAAAEIARHATALDAGAAGRDP